jgi:MFS family permease
MSQSTTEAAPASAPVARAGFIGRFLSKNIIPRTATGRRFAFIAMIDSLGSGMYYAGSALFFTRVVGLSVGQVGIGLSLAGLVGFLGVVPVGMLADRVRAGRIYVALQLWRAAGFAAYCFAGSFPVFVAIACAISLADAAVPPISQAVVGAAVSSEDRVDTMAKIRAVRNVGFGLGALVAAGAIQYGSRAAFVFLIAGNAVSFLIAALMLWSARVTQLITVGKSAKGTRPTLVADARYIAAAVLNGLLSVHLWLLPLALPLLIATRTKVPIGTFGILFMLNTVMAVLLQARFARSADKLRGAVTCAVLAGASLAAFGVVAYLMGQVHLVVLATLLAVAAVVLITFGEMWQSAAGWTISYELARPERRAQYLSTFQMGTVVQVAAAPWVLTHLVMPNPHGWLIFAAVIAMAGLAMAIVIDIPGRRRVSVTMGAATGGLAVALCGGIAAGVLLFSPNHLVHAPNPIGPAANSSPYQSSPPSSPSPTRPTGPRTPAKAASGRPSDPSGPHSSRPSGPHSDRPSGPHSVRHSGRPSDPHSGVPSDLPADLPSILQSNLPSGLLSNLPSGLLSNLPSDLP